MTLVDLNIKEFMHQVAQDSPAPGGGSIAALAGSLAAALCAMVSRLTLGREKYRPVWKDMERVRDSADGLAKRLLSLMDKDTESFDRVMAAFRLPKDTREQKAARANAIQEAYRQAALVPLETLRAVDELAGLVQEVLIKGNPNCITDAGVSAQLLRAAAVGAAYNVRVNLMAITDPGFSGPLDKVVLDLVKGIDKTVVELGKRVEETLE